MSGGWAVCCHKFIVFSSVGNIFCPYFFSTEVVPQEARHHAMKSMCRTSADSMNPCSRQRQSCQMTTDWPHHPCPPVPPFWLLSGETLQWEETRRTIVEHKVNGQRQPAVCFPSATTALGCFAGAFMYVSVKENLEPHRILHRWVCLSLEPSIPSGGYSTRPPINTETLDESPNNHLHIYSTIYKASSCLLSLSSQPLGVFRPASALSMLPCLFLSSVSIWARKALWELKGSL